MEKSTGFIVFLLFLSLAMVNGATTISKTYEKMASIKVNPKLWVKDAEFYKVVPSTWPVISNEQAYFNYIAQKLLMAEKIRTCDPNNTILNAIKSQPLDQNKELMHFMNVTKATHMTSLEHLPRDLKEKVMDYQISVILQVRKLPDYVEPLDCIAFEIFNSNSFEMDIYRQMLAFFDREGKDVDDFTKVLMHINGAKVISNARSTPVFELQADNNANILKKLKVSEKLQVCDPSSILVKATKNRPIKEEEEQWKQFKTMQKGRYIENLPQDLKDKISKFLVQNYLSINRMQPEYAKPLDCVVSKIYGDRSYEMDLYRSKLDYLHFCPKAREEVDDFTKAMVHIYGARHNNIAARSIINPRLLEEANVNFLRNLF